MHEAKPIKRTFAPMLWMNLLFGMGVLDLEPNLFNNILEYAYTASYLILFNGLVILSSSSVVEASQSQLLNVGEIIYNSSVVSNVAVMNIVIIVSRINSQKLGRVLKLIESYDRKMRNTELASRHHALIVYQVKIIILYAFSVISYLIAMYTNMSKEFATIVRFKSLWDVLIMIIFLFWTFVFDISFLTWIKYFRLEFQRMNQAVRDMLTSTPDSPRDKRILKMQENVKNKMFISIRSECAHGRNANVHIIRGIKEKHLELIKIARLMNASYGIQIVLYMTISFIFVISLLYVLYTLIWTNLEIHILLSITIPFVYYVVFYLWRIVYENHVCTETCAEATEIGDIICELYEPSTSKEFRTEIQDFTLQLIQNPLVFTGYGFFYLGHSFIQETIGSITTYLVILIQVADMSIEVTSTTKNNTESVISL